MNKRGWMPRNRGWRIELLLLASLIVLGGCLWMQTQELRALGRDLKSLERENQVQAGSIVQLSKKIRQMGWH